MNANHRGKMVDWMIQVFRVFDNTSDKTLFIAVDIIDRFFESLQKTGRVLLKEEFHKYGLTCIYIASKLEDEFPITMDQITIEAGHNRVPASEIVQAEREVY